MNMLHFVYPTIYLWTFGLYPLFGYYKECFYEQFVYKFLFEHIFSILSGIYLRIELPGHMVIIYLSF